MIRSSILVLPWLFLLVACGKRVEVVDLRSAPVDAIEQGVSLMATHCDTCHGVGERAMEEMLAPPLWGVRAHYRARFPEPGSFVDAMTAYILDPRTEKSLMPHAVEHYGLKAPVSHTEAEVRSAVWAIYAGQVERPPWSWEYRKRHRECDVPW